MANTFNNVNSLKVKLNAIGKTTAQEVSKAIRRGGLRIENNAAQKIVNPPKTGRIYPSKYRKGAFHQASAPGESPAADSGRLDQSITSVMTQEGPEVYQSQTGSNVDYGTYLELGTAKIAPRPWLAPAFEEEKDKVIADIKAAVVRGATSGSK